MEIDRELLTIAFRNLKIHKTRSLLTLLGIIIGIGAIAALFSIGEGLNQAINQEFEALGLNTIMVEPGTSMGLSTAIARTLKEEDIGIIENIPGVDSVMGFYETVTISEYRDKQSSVFLIGFDPRKTEYMEQVGYIDIIKGRKLEPNDKYAIVIPESFSSEGFQNETLRVKDNLEMNGQKFKIVGVSKNMGGTFGALAPANIVFVPKETMRDFFREEDPVEMIVVATDKQVVDEVAEKIEERLKKAHGEEDFYVLTTENILEVAGDIILVVQVGVSLLAGISLIVGAIGIMNTMLMAVMERTREIGIMKAIGAKNSQIKALFLTEAAMIGGVGGMLGVLFGLSLAALTSLISAYAGFPLPFKANYAAVFALFWLAVAIGTTFGYFPARRAARLDPVEALRY